MKLTVSTGPRFCQQLTVNNGKISWRYLKGMRISELRELLSVRRPEAPYGDRRLARAYSIEDLRRIATRRVAAGAMAYIEGGADDEVSLRRNRAAYDDYELQPRVLRDVSKIDLSTSVLGTPLSLPFALAPIGSPRLFHHDGELATARAAARAGIAFSLSSSGTRSIERIARDVDVPRWYQLYVWNDRGLVKDLLTRAKASGYRALLLTVDTAVPSKRERELRSGLMLPNPALRLSTVLEGAFHPSWWWHFFTSEAIRFANLTPDGAPASVGFARMAHSFDGSLSWADVDWIRETWGGPICLKGVQTVADATQAADLGMDAIVVSNHGGRQLDRVPATIDSLGPIAAAVGERIDVLLDGGIRRGSDIVTALALGAKACLIGRAHIYGLAAAGEAGVNRAIEILADEVRTSMALLGATSVDQLDPSYVRRRQSRPDPT
jgi:L-lactate dehydrogenase (cytochrome)